MKYNKVNMNENYINNKDIIDNSVKINNSNVKSDEELKLYNNKIKNIAELIDNNLTLNNNEFKKYKEMKCNYKIKFKKILKFKKIII